MPGDSNSLVNPSVERLFVDSKGNIWIGTKSGGVSKYNPVTGVFKNFVTNYKTSNDLLTDNRILSFNEDDEGRIWMGTWENGVVIYDETNNTWQQFLETDRVNCIVKTSDGKMWVGTNDEIQEFDASNNSFKPYQVGSSQNMVYDDKRNLLWMVQSGNEGFRKFDLRSLQSERLKMPSSVSNLKLGNQPYESILIDSKDRCWLGTWGTGLYTFSPSNERFSRYQIYPGNRGTINKDYDAILNIFEDCDGNIWLGTNGGGVCVLTEKLKFNSVGFHPEANKGLENTRIMSVVDDQKGNLWLGTIGSGLGKSQSQDFDAQIADISIAMIEYNVFSLAKRFEAYETIGGLFEHTKDHAMELTISLRIWGFILEMLLIIAEFIDGDFNELIVNVMKNKPEDNKIFRLIESQLSEAA